MGGQINEWLNYDEFMSEAFEGMHDRNYIHLMETLHTMFYYHRNVSYLLQVTSWGSHPHIDYGREIPT